MQIYFNFDANIYNFVRFLKYFEDFTISEQNNLISDIVSEEAEAFLNFKTKVRLNSAFFLFIYS